jgi:hypothetical protein
MLTEIATSQSQTAMLYHSVYHNVADSWYYNNKD